MQSARAKLTQLRQLMSKTGVDAYYVPSTDPHQSEYVPDCWQRRQWLSGFCGSAGDLVVTSGKAGLWTDGRYWLQAAAELKGSGIKLYKQGEEGVPSLADWLADTLAQGQVVGVDARLLSRDGQQGLKDTLAKTGVQLKLMETNLVDQLWEARPPRSQAPVELHPQSYAGESAASKLRRLRKVMRERRAEAHVLTTLDTIAWLFNIRSQDVDYNPVVIAYAIITPDSAQLFFDLAKADTKVAGRLAKVAQLLPYEAVGAELGRLAKQGARVWVDGKTVNAWVLKKLKRCPLIGEPTPVAQMKAKKNETEIAGVRAALVRDGVAMVRFLSWLEQAVPRGGVSEISAAERLAALRAEGEAFRGESFAPIAAYAGHGAVVHYSATPESDAELKPAGIFLIDSGGQYLDGTTDITRTVLLGGEPTAEQRDHFTRVLEGHIAIARLRFPAGTAGRQIDAFARQALWEAGLNYKHGTGHGVGFFLNVHEGPQSISHTRCTGAALEEGNLLSNEPGYYKEGEYGIRLENLVLVVRDEALSRAGETFLRFETLTLCPLDTRLVEPALLSAEELQWLNAYHRQVEEALAPRLDGEARRWLKRATRPLGKRR